MVKIIREGTNKFQAICSKCGCEFSYELEDLDSLNYVECPFCHEEYKHKDQTPKFPDRRDFWYTNDNQYILR